MLNYTIVVNDGGELKSVTASDVEAWAKDTVDSKGNTSLLAHTLSEALNEILDVRAIAAGEYDPSDNDTPIVVTMGEIKARFIPCDGCDGHECIGHCAYPGAKEASEREMMTLAWVPEDELPESMPSEAYSALFPYSRLDGIRFFPIFGPARP